MPRNLYTQEEDDFLKENYQRMTKEELAETLGRTRKSVEKRMLSVLGLKIGYKTRDSIRKSTNTTKNKNERELHRDKVPDEWFALPSSREEAEDLHSEYFFTGKPCERGHIDIRGANHMMCLACKRENLVLTSQSEERKEWRRNYRKQEHIRSKDNDYRRKMLKEDPIFRLRLNASTRISNFFAGRKSAGKLEKTEELLGCTYKEFHAWIEQQMSDGMTMENYGLTGWHLDHFRPVMSFKDKNIDGDEKVQRVAFNWRNYQPLWGNENQSKNDEWNEELENKWVNRMRTLGWEGELFYCFIEQKD